MAGPVLLAIETSTPRGGVAVVALDGAEAPGATRTYDGTRGHAEDLLFAVEDALRSASATPADIAVVAVSVGPGSFTGVRVGVSTAKGLALARAVSIVSATSLEVLAAAEEFPGGTRVALLDAKRGEVYAAAFDEAMGPLGAAELRRVESIGPWLATLPSPLLLVGDGAALVASPAGARVSATTPDAVVLARLGLAKMRAGRTTDAAALEPVYLRAPDVSLPASRGGPIG